MGETINRPHIYREEKQLSKHEHEALQVFVFMYKNVILSKNGME
jgi:hypothetical protein